MADISKIKPLGSNTTYNIKDASAIKQIQKGSANGTIKYSLRGTPSTYTSDISIVDLTSYALLDSPEFTGTPKAPTAANGTNNTQIANTAFVMNTLKYSDAMIFKGTVAGSSSAPGGFTVAANCGDTYKVSTAGYVNGVKVEVGDIFICTTDNTAAATSSNYSTIQANWVVLQTNADGIVTGPASATDSAIALYNGTSGKTIKNSSKTLTEDTVSNTSTNSTIPTSKAVWDAIAGLDGNLNSTAPGAGKTLTAFSQTDGKISATFGNISITKSQISDFPTSMTPTSHSHGNIANGGTITSNTVALGNGDMLLFSDSSNNGKIERSSITIGTATTTYLRNDGTWGTPAGTYTLPIATYNTLGGLKPAYTSTGAATGYTAATNTSTPALQSRTTTASRYYAIEADKNGIPFVNVPWSDTNKYHKTGSWSGLTYTASAVNSADELKFTIPTGTTSTTVAVGNHTHSASLGTDTGTATVILEHDTTYKLTAGGNSIIFKTPVDNNTDTKVTSAANHYTPSADTNSALSVDASSTTAATWNSTSLVTGVNIQRDAKGHVTGLTVDSIKMPANPNSNTTYSLSGAYGTNNATWVNTLTPSSGSATTSTVPAMVGASSSAAGKGGLVPVPAAGKQTSFLRGDGTWVVPTDTDTKVKQTVKSDNVEYKILTTASATPTSGNAAEAVYDTGVTINPSTHTITATNFNGNLKTNNLIPAIYKKYESTSQYATAANSDKANFYFMSVKPDSFVKPWTIHFKVHSFCPAYPNGDSVTDCILSGRTNSLIYHNWNEKYETAHYYICSLNLTQSGFNAGLGHAIGISLLYGWNYTNSAYYRTFEVEVYNWENCTINLLDAPVLKENWTNYNTTNYSNHNHYNAVDRGLIETADYDTTGRDYSHSGYLKNSSTFRLAPNSLFGLDRNNNAQGISLYSSEYTSSTISTNVARVYNTAGFDWTKGLYYSNNGTNYAKGADLNFSPAYFYYAMDLRYSDNCLATSAATTLGMVPRKSVYFRGVIKEDGLFYLAPITVTYNSASYKRVWTQDIPTAVETDGTYQYVYWFIGWPYYNGSYANGQYQVNLHTENKLYWYHNNRFEEYSGGARGIANITRSGTTFTVTRDDGSTFTFNQQDNNTWRGIQDNLTSDSATDSLSAKQGKALANGSARDNTKLPLAGGTMTGAIQRYYSAASTDPVLSITSNDKDVTLFNIGHGTAAGTPSSCWYRLVYKGTGSSPNNTLQLIAAKSTTESTAIEMNEDGIITFNGTGIFKKTTDAAGTANNSPALIIGGTATQAHIEIDANEIMAKSNGTTTATLYLNNDGGEVQIGGKVAARVTSAPTSGQVMIADGTGGLIKSSGYTIAKSVPSNAVFTDTNNAVTQTNQTGANDYRILLSGSANDTTATEGANKSTNLRFNPSTKVFSVGGDINATGDLTLTGNANLNSETYAESITASSLLVNGAANFVNIPTAPTPAATSNDTSIATTAFVMNAFTANDAMVFKGVINANSALPADHKQGWTYRIGTAGTYANKVCEVGDIIICVTEGTSANNDHWAVIQNNVDGAVYKGTNAFTDAHVIVADSTAGKVKDSEKTITTTAPSSSAADTTIPTSKAVWSAISGASGYGKTGTVTSVQVAATSPVVSSSSSASTTTLSTTISLADGYGDTKNPYASKTAKYVLAAPNASNGAPTFRQLELSDLSGVDDLSKIEALTGTSGLLKKTAANTWTLDTTAYTTNTGTVTKVSTGVGLTGGDVTTTGTIKAKLKSETAFTADSAAQTNTANRQYMVGVDKSGYLSVNIPWTDASVSSAANHYTPTADSSSQLSVDASSTTAATWNSTSLVTGVNIQRDAKGHVTGVTVDSIKMPANPNTNTDTLVKQTVKTDNVNYKLLATTSASPSSGTAMEATYSANVYANPSTGAVSAVRHTLNVGGTDKAYMAFNSTTNAIDFIFA